MSHLPPLNSTNQLQLNSRSKALLITETFIYTTIALTAFLGNSLVLWIVYRNHSLRTIPNYFVISLAFSDIAMALLATPWSVVVLTTGKWPSDFVSCQFQGYIVLFFGLASLQNLTIMAINRYTRIVKPAIYRKVFTAKNTILFILGAYLLSSLPPSMSYLIAGNVYMFQPGKFFCYQKSTLEFTIPLIAIFVGVPTFVIVTCYFKVFLALRTHSKNMLKRTQQQSFRITVEDVKVTKTLFATVVAFLLCWMPIILIEFIDLSRGDTTLPRQVYIMFTMCGLSSSAVNPIIYGVMNKTFRKEYKRVLTCM